MSLVVQLLVQIVHDKLSYRPLIFVLCMHGACDNNSAGVPSQLSFLTGDVLDLWPLALSEHALYPTMRTSCFFPLT